MGAAEEGVERAVGWTEGDPRLRMAMPGPEGHRLLVAGRRLLGKTLLCRPPVLGAVRLQGTCRPSAQAPGGRERRGLGEGGGRLPGRAGWRCFHTPCCWKQPVQLGGPPQGR